MTFDLQAILDRIDERWMLATTLQRWLVSGSFVLAFAFFLVLWTPLGNRRTALKCMVLAMLVHLLAWGFVAEIIPPGTKMTAPKEERVKISLASPPPGGSSKPKLPETISLAPAKRANLIDPAPPREKKSDPILLKADLSPPPVEIERPRIQSKTPEITEPAQPKIRPIELSPVDVAEAPVPAAPKARSVVAPKLAGDRPTLERATRPQGTLPPARTTAPVNDLAKELDIPFSTRPSAVSQSKAGDLASAATPGKSDVDFGLPALDVPAIEPPPAAGKGNGKGGGVADGSGNGKGNGNGNGMGDGNGSGIGKSPIGPLNPKAKETYGERFAEDRMKKVQERGGSADTEKAVAAALDWLAAHQSADGRWDADNFSLRCPDGDLCSGHATEKNSDTGVTGLTLLAFLGAGHTHLTGKHQVTVRRGLEWLINTQEQDSNLMGQGYLYSHAIATLSLCEAFGMTNDRRIEKAAQQAINWLVDAQHDAGGWRYRPNEPGDLSVHGWVVLSLRSAQLAGLKVPKTCFDRAKGFLNQVTTGPNKGLGCYQNGFQPSHPMTAEALVCRQVLGVPRSDPAMDEAADFILGKLPSQNDYHIYYWYYGTLGMFQLGDRYWERWNARLTSTLLSTQEKSGHRAGSWAPQTPFGTDGGRIFTTAASAMCLEAYYRYLPIYRKQETGRSAAANDSTEAQPRDRREP